MAGMTVLLLLLWAGVTVSSPVDLQKRVVGGHTCDNNKRHYHVYVEVVEGTAIFMCGGSLIHKDWVLTAGHCNKSEVTAYMSVHPGDIGQNAHKERKTIQPRKIYKESGQEHDLMLLQLPSSSKVTPIDLPTKSECTKQINEVEVAGYGGIATPSTLQCGDMKMLSKTECDERKDDLKTCSDPVAASKSYQNIICYSSTTVSAVRGDSGGGVVHDDKLYGVHVLGSKNATSCVNKRGMAMDLCNKDYRDWIKKYTGIPFK